MSHGIDYGNLLMLEMRNSNSITGFLGFCMRVAGMIVYLSATVALTVEQQFRRLLFSVSRFAGVA